MKINLSTILGGFNLSAINERLRKIEEEFNTRVLYRDNPSGEPNQMQHDLDLNGHRILNVSGIEIGESTDLPKPATVLPKAVALFPEVGTSLRYAREDHVHEGLQGMPGNDGSAGKSNALIYAYKRSAVAPTDNPGNITYDFWTAKISLPEGDALANGWSKEIPDGTDQLYVSACTAASDERTDSVLASEWSTPVMLAANGADGSNGLNAATIFIYQRTPTPAPPTLPSIGVTYTFSPPTVAGLNNGWSQAIPDVVYGDYLWVSTATAAATVSTDNILPTEWSVPQIMGRKGDSGKDGANGGLSNAVVNAYKRSATVPTDTPGNVTYSFSQAAITVPDTLGNGWLKAIPNGTDPLYVVSASASGFSATDDINATEWTAPVKLTQNGTDGLNTATIYIYQRASSVTPPVLPVADVVYDFQAKTLTGLSAGWTTSIPSATEGDYLFVATATAASTTGTDTIPSTEWAAPTLFAQSGIPGVATSNIFAYKRAAAAPVDTPGAIVWSFAAGAVTTPSTDALANGWTKSIPAGTDPLYVTVATASGSGTTDAIASNEWSTPVILAKDGAGVNVATVYIYQRTNSTSVPVLPSATTTYTFNPISVTGLNNGWTSTIPASSGGMYLWVSTATASSGTNTDTLLSTEWATAQVMAKDGTNGTNGSSGSNGQRGTATLARAVSGSSWTDSEATNALVSAGYYPPVNRDIVTQYNSGSGFSETRYYDNGSWIKLDAYVNGNMLVSGTLSASKLSGGTITGVTINIGSGNFRVYDNGSGVINTTAAFLAGTRATYDNSASPIGPAITARAGFGSYEALYAINDSGDSTAHGVRGKAKIFASTNYASGLVGASNGYDFYAEGAGTNYGPFTGSHDCLIPNGVSIVPGDIVVDVKCVGRGNLSNTIFEVETSKSAMNKNPIGVFVHATQKLTGFIPAAFKQDMETYNRVKYMYTLGSVNALGEGQINVCGEHGDIEAGDFIITSNMPGKGMRQLDDVQHNYTVARAREACKFTSPSEVKTIACIYLCG